MIVDKINEIERSRPVSNIGQVKDYSKIDSIEINLLRKKAIMQDAAAYSNHWFYYKQILDIQDAIRCHKEILEKYPYDGKSTFKELLKKEIDKNNI